MRSGPVSSPIIDRLRGDDRTGETFQSLVAPFARAATRISQFRVLVDRRAGSILDRDSMRDSVHNRAARLSATVSRTLRRMGSQRGDWRPDLRRESGAARGREKERERERERERETERETAQSCNLCLTALAVR